MAKINRSGSDDSGFVRSKLKNVLAAGAFAAAFAGSANAQWNRSPDMPELDAESVVSNVKNQANDQLKMDDQFTFTQADIDKINGKGQPLGSKSIYALPKPEKKPLAFPPLAATDEMGKPTLRAVPQIMLSTGNGKQVVGAAIDPSLKGGSAYVAEEGSYRADVGLLKDVGSIKDTRLKASFQVLYAAQQLGTYVGVEKGSELEKFVIAESIKVSGGKFQITAALLKRMVEVNFSEVNKTEKVEMSQKALGVDFTKGFARESLLQEIKTSIVYFDVTGKNLGKIGNIVNETTTNFEQFRVDGGVRGGNKLVAEVTAVIKATEKIRADVTLGVERTTYEAMFDVGQETKMSATGGLGLTYQPDSHNRVKATFRSSQGSSTAGIKYEHDFGNNVTAFAEASRTKYSTGIESTTQALVGINVALDPVKKGSKISPLFTDWSDKTKLALADVNYNHRAAVDTIEVMKKVTYKEREIRIDKTTLPGTSFLEKNADGTLAALNLDTGSNNLVSVSSSNLPAPYSTYLSVSGGRYLRVANFEKFAAIAPVTANVSLADNVGTFTIVTFDIQKGSALFQSGMSSLPNVSALDAAAFVAGTKTLAQIQASMAGNTAPTLSDVVAQTLNEDGSVTVNVTLADAQTALASLVLTATSSDTTLFPNGSIVLGGSGANRTITLNPAADKFGSATITSTVTDGGGLTTSKSFVVTVNSVNDVPVFSSTQTAFALTQGVAMASTVLPIAADADTANVLTFSVSALPAGLSFAPATRTLSGTPSVSGTFPITYSVFDGTVTISQTFNLVISVPVDTTPDAFTFADASAVALSTVMTSVGITVAGVNTATPISIVGGTYSINGGAYTASAGTVNNGDVVTVRHTSSASFSTATNSVVTIGGVTDTYTSTTLASDTTPAAFTFVDQTGVALSTVVTSAGITVSGVNSAAPISITGGTYAINGGAYTASAGTVNNGDVVTVRLTSSASLGTAVSAVLNVGGVTDSFDVTTLATDTTPDAFAFTPQSGAALSTVVASNSITVSGINSASPITVTGGEYRINGGAWVSSAGSVVNGNTVEVRVTSPAGFAASATATLDIGGVSNAFTVTTLGADTTPAAFTFVDQTGVALSTVVTSAGITVTGVNTAAPISITGGTYSINGGAYTASAGTVNLNDTVTVRVTSSGSLATTASAVLNVGGVTDSFDVTTLATDTTPDAFSFTDATSVALSTVMTSAGITVAGINSATPISITGGTYSINGGAYTASAGTVNNGDVVTVRHTSSASFWTATNSVVTIGGVSDTYTSTTLAADTTPAAFTFVDQTGAALSSTATSATITVSGINTATAISITGGQYSINGGAYTASAGTVVNGDTVAVRVVASGSAGVTTSGVVNIGGVTDSFDVTTVGVDTTPDAFSFVAQSSVALSSTITSAAITVAGINTASAISIVGGQYSINGGAYTASAGTVNNGDNVTVQLTSSGSFGTGVSSTVTIGGVSNAFTATTLVSDTTPDAFSFVDQTGAALGATVAFPAITVAGVNTATAISITGGEYSKNGGAFTASAGTVVNGDTVAVRLVASATPGVTVGGTLTIGGVQDDFFLSNTPADTTPDAFSFVDQTGVALSTLSTSAPIVVAGVNSATAISITGGQYSKNGGAYTASAGTVVNGDSITVQHTSSGSNATATDSVLTIGGVSDTFTTTTLAANAAPTLGDIVAQTANIDGQTLNLTAVSVGDTETAAASLVMSATSSNQALVPNANLVWSGSGASRDLSVTTVAGVSGSATITYTVTDGSGTPTSKTFTVSTVDRASSFAAPTLSAKTSSTVNVNLGAVTDLDGVTLKTVEYSTVSNFASVDGTSATGTFSGLSAGTTYYFRMKADVKDGATGATSTQYSTNLSVTTDVANAAPVLNSSPAYTQLIKDDAPHAYTATIGGIFSDDKPGTIVTIEVGGTVWGQISLDNITFVSAGSTVSKANDTGNITVYYRYSGISAGTTGTSDYVTAYVTDSDGAVSSTELITTFTTD